VDDFNPYAAPEIGISQARLSTEADEGRGVWQDGKILVMAKVARLPSRCVKCNEPATYRLRRTLSWHSPWLFLMFIFPGWLIYLIVALIVRKTAKIELPLCDEHRTQRSKGILIAWIVSLSGIALCFAMAFGNDDRLGFLVLAGLIMLIFGLIFGLIRSQVVSTQKIDDTHVWLKKVSPLYLAELPKLPYSDDWEMEAKPKVQWDEL
jgi:hypothetical protein